MCGSFTIRQHRSLDVAARRMAWRAGVKAAETEESFAPADTERREEMGQSARLFRLLEQSTSTKACVRLICASAPNPPLP